MFTNAFSFETGRQRSQKMELLCFTILLDRIGLKVVFNIFC